MWFIDVCNGYKVNIYKHEQIQNMNKKLILLMKLIIVVYLMKAG